MVERTLDPDPDAQRRDWLDLSRDELARVYREGVDGLAQKTNELAAMQAALDALRRHPDAATAREACRRECLLAVTTPCAQRRPAMADAVPAPTPWVFSPQEAAKVLGLSRDSVYEAIARKEIPAHRIGGQWRIPAAELAAMCGIREARSVTAVREELARAQDEIALVIATGRLERLAIERLLEAREQIARAERLLTAQERQE